MYFRLYDCHTTLHAAMERQLRFHSTNPDIPSFHDMFMLEGMTYKVILYIPPDSTHPADSITVHVWTDQCDKDCPDHLSLGLHCMIEVKTQRYWWIVELVLAGQGQLWCHTYMPQIPIWLMKRHMALYMPSDLCTHMSAWKIFCRIYIQRGDFFMYDIHRMF